MKKTNRPQGQRFTLVVSGWGGYPISRKEAELAVLSCFAQRAPDGCEFRLLRKAPAKDQ